MKLVFMGTPVYALSCLEALIAAGHEIAQCSLSLTSRRTAASRYK